MGKMKEIDEQMKTIDFTPEKLFLFKRAYEQAEKRGDETFYFEGEWLLGYAKYAIIYLEGRFGIKEYDKNIFAGR